MTHTSSTPHHFLSQLAGGWTGTSKLWLEPGKLADEAPLVGSIQLLLDGRFALFLYQSSIEGEAQHGMFTFGYNTAIMFCTGDAADNGFSVLGSYPDPSGGPDWGWRTEVTLEDADHLTITAYNIHPEYGEAKATEAKLTRIKT